MKKLLTVRETAEILHLSTWSIYMKSLRQELPVIRLGRSLRFDEEKIKLFLERNSVPTIEENVK